MIEKRLLIVAFVLMLFGCVETKATLDSRIEEAISTASGTIHEAGNRIDEAVKPIVETASEVQERAGRVKTGWEKLRDAFAEFRAAIGD